MSQRDDFPHVNESLNQYANRISDQLRIWRRLAFIMLFAFAISVLAAIGLVTFLVGIQ